MRFPVHRGSWRAAVCSVLCARLSGRAGVSIGSRAALVLCATVGLLSLWSSPALAAAPVAVTEAASNVQETSATFNGTVVPNGTVTNCHFQYGPEGFGQILPCAQSPVEIGSGSSPVSVSADVGGLLPVSAYGFSLVVQAEGEGHGSEVKFTTAVGEPLVVGESFAVGEVGGTLSARVYTGGFATTYQFEYGRSAAYGSITPPASLGAAEGSVSAPAQVAGLQPGVSYHFRVIASNEDGTVRGADATFSTYPESFLGLPDGRVYEMVTPPENHDADVYVPNHTGYGEIGPEQEVGAIRTKLPFQAAADGDRVAYVGAPTVEGGENHGEEGGNQYLATRSAGGGWTQAVIQPLELGSPQFQGFSSDLTVGILDSTEPLAPGVPGGGGGECGKGGYDDLYTVSTAGDAGYDPLLTTTPPYRTVKEFGAAGLPGALHRTCPSALRYAGTSVDFSDVLFEANDALTAAGGGRPAAEGGAALGGENNLYESVGGVLQLVNVLPDGSTEAGATFGSGPRFSDVISADGSRVFWTDLAAGADEGHVFVRENGTSTVAVSAGAATYGTATPDGRFVFYTEAGALYRFDVDSEAREQLLGVGAQGVVGASEDGGYVYYLAGGDLYLLRESGGVWGSSVLVAATTPGPAEVTPDAHSIAFVSSASLTGYANEGLEEVFVYDADTARLSCVSCDPTGAPPSVREGYAFAVAARQPSSLSLTYQPRWISADGSRVFFESYEPLVAQDTNGKLDVYEWEREGAGSCTASGGCVYLLSAGTSTAESFMLDASVNGDDVFIITRSRLTSQDGNENFNLFDARVGGVVPLAAPACTGSGCQGVPAAPPVFATPASVTFAGVGNFTAPSEPVVKAKPKPKKTKPKKKKRAKPKPKPKRNAKRAKRSVAGGRGRAGAKAGRS